MNLIEILKEWSGVVLAIGAAIYGVVKYINDYHNGREGVKQNQQHTEQAKLDTDEKALDLDSRRVKASEEVASEALEDMAEARRENLKLLESDYEKSKAIIEMQAEIKLINAKIEKMEIERTVVYHYYCELAETCPKKKPPYGPYRLDAAALEVLKKKIMNDGKTA